MVRYGSRWLLFYSANEWNTADYATGVAFCDSPVGPCTKSPHNPVLRSEGSILGPGAPSAFVDAGGSLRLAHHYWRAPHVGYPSDPGLRRHRPPYRRSRTAPARASAACGSPTSPSAPTG